MTTTLTVRALTGYSSDHRPVLLDGPVGLIITYNAGNASDAKLLADLRRLLALKPLAIGLQEVADRRSVLAQAAREAGYTLFQRPGGTRGHVALLVRSDARPRNDRLHQIGKRTHVGTDVAGARKDGWTAAKYILAVDVTDQGEDRTVATFHLVPSASHSEAASRLLATQAAHAAAWLGEQPLTTDLMGDCNGRPSRREFAPLRKVAEPYSASSRKGAPIDIHWVREAAPKPAPKPSPEEPVKIAPPSPPFIGARHHGGSQTPHAIVMHATVSPDNPGTARSIAEWWHGPSSPVTSAHYVVDPKETIQCVGDHSIAYHCGYNTGSIGVEMCDEETGPASRWRDADSTAIIDHAAALVARLCLAYGIEMKRPTVAELKAKGPHGIYGHNDSRLAFGHTTHTDPRDFPWDDFMRKVHAAADALTHGNTPQLSEEDDMPAPKDIWEGKDVADEIPAPKVGGEFVPGYSAKNPGAAPRHAVGRTWQNTVVILGLLRSLADTDALADKIAARVNVSGASAEALKKAVQDGIREMVEDDS